MKAHSRTLVVSLISTALILLFVRPDQSSASNRLSQLLAHTVSPQQAVTTALHFDQTYRGGATHFRFAYLAECVNENGYCSTRLRGLQNTARKYGFTIKIFDSVFNPATQLKQVQDAVSAGFDGYLFAPAASTPGCQMWKQYLQPTHKPVVTLDIPMCGSTNYTPGLAATVTMQSEAYFFKHVDAAFASCRQPCEAAAVGGFTGSDLFGYWETAISRAAARHPNVKVVVNQPGNFDPNVANRVIQDGLRSHPNIKLIVSSWDQMTLGAESAVRAAGKIPGKDIRIYSVGADRDAVSQVRAGTFTETTILLPYQEAYYGGVTLVMAKKGHPVKGYINEALLPVVKNGPGSIFIRVNNASRFRPTY